jgi:imidazolonepropionase-like amidohydrolase
MHRLICTILALVVGASPLAHAQEPIVLRAVHMVDVTGGELISPAVIVGTGEKISSVGFGGVPTGAQTIDLGDLTLLPGLIDAHTHLTQDISGDWVTRPVTELPADAALRGAMNARKTLLAGFTTVRDVGAAGFADVSLMKAIDAGFVPGPRMIPSAHAIGITGGHCDDTGWGDGRERANVQRWSGRRGRRSGQGSTPPDKPWSQSSKSVRRRGLSAMQLSGPSS